MSKSVLSGRGPLCDAYLKTMPNTDDSIDSLIRAAREDAADTSCVEFAFETRVMARLREERSLGVASWAWRLAPFFAALVVAAGMWGGADTAHLQTTAAMMADAVREHPDRIFLSLVRQDH
jgi:hypothetical protein